MKHRAGFTLLELSIVLIVLALIAGSIFVGQSMLRASHLRSAMAEATQIMQSISAFRDKYLALPGDFLGGQTLWGPATGPTNCDGNGDGRITDQTGGTDYPEQFCAWWHLIQAGMLEGNVTGLTGSAGVQDRVPGSTVPASKLAAAGWGVVTLLISDLDGFGGSITDLPYVTGDIPPGIVLWLGGKSITGSNNLMANVLQTDEAKDIDKKLDDGLPTTGKIVSQYSTTCYASDQYILSQTGLACAIVFKTGL